MARVLLLVIKFGLLAVIYFFIFRVFHFILNDLRRGSMKEAGAPTGRKAVTGAELVVAESADPAIRPGTIVKLGRETRIGRGRRNQVKLTDTFVSHDHAQIIFDGEAFLIEDLDSINGTYINGVRIKKPVVLAHGDTVKIAGVTFKFVRWEYEVE